MNNRIKRTLVRAVVDAVLRDINDNTTTCIAFRHTLAKLAKKDLWTKSTKFGKFEKSDIDNQCDVEDMEDIWVEMIRNQASYFYPN